MRFTIPNMRFTITKKIFIGFLLILSLSLLNGGVGLYNLFRSKKMTKEAIELNFQLHGFMKSIKDNLLEARKSEKDFLLSGEEGYVEDFERRVKAIRNTCSRMIALKPGPHRAKKIYSILAYLDEYHKGFLLVAEKIREKGDKDRGLMALFDKQVTKLEEQVKRSGNRGLYIDFLKIRGIEKDYLRLGEVELIDRLRKEVQLFKKRVGRGKLRKEVDRYLDLFIKIVVIDAAVERLRGIYTDTARQIEAMVEETTRKSTEASAAHVRRAELLSRRTIRAMILVMLLSVVIGVSLSVALSKGITRPLAKTVAVTEEVSRGDLTKKVDVATRDEFGDLAAAFNEMIENLRELTSRIKDAGLKIGSSADEILAASKQQANSAMEQSASVEEVTVTIEELSKTAANISENSELVSSAADKTLKSAQEAQDKVQETLAEFRKISEKTKQSSNVIIQLEDRSKDIEKVVDLINDIAAEIKILSLNAAIEASRAGEAGKGFGVVASEIRKLVERTAKSTATIKEIVSEIRSSVNQSVMAAEESVKGVEAQALLVEKVGDFLHQILKMAEETAEFARQISQATQQQKLGSEQTAKTMRELSEIIKQTATTTKQSSEAAGELSSLAEELKRAVLKFKLDGVE